MNNEGSFANDICFTPRVLVEEVASMSSATHLPLSNNAELFNAKLVFLDMQEMDAFW